MTKNGNLDEMIKINKSMPNDKFLSMKQYGNYTLLIYAASEGFIDIVEYLLSIKANPNEFSNVIFYLNQTFRTYRMASHHCIVPATLIVWT